jgi:hypothetical protein
MRKIQILLKEETKIQGTFFMLLLEFYFLILLIEVLLLIPLHLLNHEPALHPIYPTYDQWYRSYLLIK